MAQVKVIVEGTDDQIDAFRKRVDVATQMSGVEKIDEQYYDENIFVKGTELLNEVEENEED